MKKRFLALSAAAVVGGLGLASSAQAVFFFGAGDKANDVQGLALNTGSVGHALVVPYYSTQGATQTLLSLVNTDQVNGKAVKVRFRGAANSDDVLDFTVLLSPADVWTASVYQGQDGLAYLNSIDTSCTIPSNISSGDTPFGTTRFPAYLSASQKAANTREGYIEILNMADIPPKFTATYNLDGSASAAVRQTNSGLNNDLYTAIKHVNGKPPCAGAWKKGLNTDVDVIEALYDTAEVSSTDLLPSYGLGSPTGGLMGGWFIINQETLAQYSGNDTAVKATVDIAGTGAAATTNVMFSPQLKTAFSGTPGSYTADPLLTGYAGRAPKVPIQYFDLPDLSSPMGGVATNTVNGGPTIELKTPLQQAYALADKLGRTTIYNEFVNDPTGAATGVPQSTDWIISQPTRRYFAVVDYGSSATGATLVYNDGWTSNRDYWSSGIFGTPLPYVDTAPGAGTPINAGTDLAANGKTGPGTGILTLETAGPYGPMACLSASFDALFNREETMAKPGPAVSPGPDEAKPYCGEVATATWGSSPTGAALTNTQLQNPYINGWAQFTVKGAGTAAGWVPFLGYAAESVRNQTTGKSFGITLPHRWK